ncbi:MAG: DinB family protein [Ginsengibacter sp.]
MTKLFAMTKDDIIIKMVLDAWHTHVKRTDELFTSLSEEQMMQEVAPGRNRGIYLLGHITAVHDKILPLLGLGEPMYPELYEAFVVSADKTVPDLPSIAHLKEQWKTINTKLSDCFADFKTEEWFERHNALKPEEFDKEPHRNKLNIVLNRTNHLADHFGQLKFLKRP